MKTIKTNELQKTSIKLLATEIEEAEKVFTEAKLKLQIYLKGIMDAKEVEGIFQLDETLNLKEVKKEETKIK